MRRNRACLVVWAAVVLYVTLMGWLCHNKLAAYHYRDFDLAHHTQTLRNILHGSLDCSILGIPFLGNHMVLILFPLAPLYLLFPTPMLLLSVQTLVLGMGAWGVYLFARTVLSRRWSGALALVYLVYPPLLFMNLFEFHPIVLATGFLVFALFFYRTKRFAPFLACLALAMACQENVALIAAAFGVQALVQRRSHGWVLIPLLAGSGAFLLSVLVIMPHFNRNTIQFYRLYGHIGDSLPEVFLNLLTHPGASLKASWHPQKLVFLNQLLAPVAYLSLLSPTTLIPLLPVALQRLLSQRASEAQLMYHYQAEFIPFIFAAAALGLHRLLALKRRALTAALAVVLTLFPLLALWSTGTPQYLRKQARTEHADFPVKVADRIVRQVPDDATVAATFEFLPRLSGRRDVHSVHHIFHGRHTLSDKRYEMPAGLDVLILNTMDVMTFQSRPFYGPSHYQRLQALLKGHAWKVDTNVDNLRVLRLADSPGPGLVQFLDALPRHDGLSRRVQHHRGGDIRLQAFLAGPQDTGGVSPLTLFWKKTRDTNGDYDALVTLTSGDQVVYQHEFAPGSRIYPPQSWPRGALVADRHGAYAELPNAEDLTLHVDLFRLNP